MRRVLGFLIAVMISVVTIPAVAEAPIGLIVNGRMIEMDVAPVNINGRVMVPARYVAEALGATVAWDAEKNAVVITSKQADTAVSASSSDIRWIGVRDLAEQYGVEARNDAEAKGLRLTKNGVTVLVPFGAGLSGPTMAQVGGHALTSVEVQVVDGRTSIRWDDARLLGFVE